MLNKFVICRGKHGELNSGSYCVPAAAESFRTFLLIIPHWACPGPQGDWLKTATGASRTILLGAAVSPATLHRQAPGNLCTWGCGHLGHWKHIIWECPLRPIKPEHVPVDDLQARWLWPTEERSTKDSKLLDFAKALLEALWQQRHHPAAGSGSGGFSGGSHGAVAAGHIFSAASGFTAVCSPQPNRFTTC